MDIAFFNSIGLWDSLRELIEAAGRTEFLSFILRFMSDFDGNF